MIEKTLIDAYREQVRQCLLRATKETGEPRLTESEVKELMEMFTDERPCLRNALQYTPRDGRYVAGKVIKKIGEDFSPRSSRVYSRHGSTTFI